MAYLVMEKIEFTTNPGQELYEKTALALQWLRSVEVPPGATIGRLGGSPAYHMLFRDFKAPFVFSSIEALEKYMNAVRRLLFFYIFFGIHH